MIKLNPIGLEEIYMGLKQTRDPAADLITADYPNIEWKHKQLLKPVII